MLAIRRFFSALVAVGLFAFLGYVFTLFLEPQGQGGWITAVILVVLSAIASLFVYRWLAVPGRSRFRDAGMEDDGSGLGLGLLGTSADRRRRDEPDGDDLGSGRRGHHDDGVDADDDPSGLH